MNESMRKIVYYENILEFKQNTKSELQMSEVNNWQLCRTCLAESQEGDCDLRKMCVMDAFEGKILNAQQMLGRVTKIEFTEKDDLPLKMCKDCLVKLTSLYFFSIQVQKAEKVLKSLSLKLKVSDHTPIPKATESVGQNITNSEKVDEGSNNLDIDFEILPTEDVDENCIASPLTSGKETLNENTPVALENFEIVSEETSNMRKRLVSKEKEEDPSSLTDDQECDTAIQQVSTKSEISATNENPMESNESILIEDDFDVIISDNLQSAYGFEESIKDTYETTYLNESKTNNTTVEIVIEDEQEEYFEEKTNWQEENEYDESNVETKGLFIDESTSTTIAEPVRITRAKRIVKPLKESPKPSKESPKTPKGSQFKHRQTRVTKPLLESLKCDLCQESFELQRHLVAHVKENHPNCKAYQCRECGQLFSYTQSLSRHMNTHKDQLHKNACSYCSKAFLRPTDLVRHIRTHTGERPYKCPKCNKAFKQQGEMKQHLTTHLERREYECDQCDCVLRSRNSLYLHKKTRHTKPKGQHFKCTHCKKTFKTKRDLLDHEKKIHATPKVKDRTVWHIVMEE